MRYEDFSRYTEAQVAEFVLTKKRLNREVAELTEREKWLSEKVTQLQDAAAHLEQQRDHMLGERVVLQGQVGELLEARRQLEAARAHLEQQRDHVLGERDAAIAESVRIALELSHARSDITLLHDQRALVQAELVKITHECVALQTELERRTQQRNQLRERVRSLESSRAVRIAARIRKILRRS